MKHDWKKDEKTYYAPKTHPERAVIPAFNFITIQGQRSPDTAEFKQCIQTLFSLAYTLKFSVRNGLTVEGYEDYAVYPLEGLWGISEEAQSKPEFTREDYVYTLMIRQPDFMTEHHLHWAMEKAKKKDPKLPWDRIHFEKIEDGLCVQIMHLGPFSEEPRSFSLIEDYLKDNRLKRRTMVHREIYLSDFTKTAPEKLKTVLRTFVDADDLRS